MLYVNKNVKKKKELVGFQFSTAVCVVSDIIINHVDKGVWSPSKHTEMLNFHTRARVRSECDLSAIALYRKGSLFKLYDIVRSHSDRTQIAL